jgi:hypothetical protein
MEKQVDNQLELFSQPGEDPGSRTNRTERDSFSARIWGYEKAILFIIAVLIVGIVSFSLGVERGKRIAEVVVQPAPPLKKAELSAQPAVLTQMGPYTIQVASFKARSNAEKEAQLLKKKGFTTLVLSKGSYVILCVGNFPNKETAQPLLSELSKYYRSCYIRRL